MLDLSHEVTLSRVYLELLYCFSWVKMDVVSVCVSVCLCVCALLHLLEP